MLLCASFRVLFKLCVQLGTMGHVQPVPSKSTCRHVCKERKASSLVHPRLVHSARRTTPSSTCINAGHKGSAEESAARAQTYILWHYAVCVWRRFGCCCRNWFFSRMNGIWGCVWLLFLFLPLKCALWRCSMKDVHEHFSCRQWRRGCPHRIVLFGWNVIFTKGTHMVHNFRREIGRW